MPPRRKAPLKKWTKLKSVFCESSLRRTCTFCDKRFVRYDCLESHMNVHTRERPHQCKECGDTFSFYNALFVHRNNIHNGKRSFCHLCNKTFTVLANLSIHKKRVHCTQTSTRATRVISIGMRKITQNIGILNTSRKELGTKMSVAKVTRVEEEKEIKKNSAKIVKVPAPVVALSVPTPSKLLSLVKGLELATQQRRSSVLSRHTSVDDEDSKQESPVDLKSSVVMMETESEASGFINESDPQPQLQVLSADLSSATPAHVSSDPEKEPANCETFGHCQIKINKDTPNPQPSSTINHTTTQEVKKEQENDAAIPPLTSSSSIPPAMQLHELPKTPQEFPILVYVGPEGTITPATRIEVPATPWSNRPPDPPPNLMFYLNGMLVPVLSLDVLRSMRSPPSPASSPPTSDNDECFDFEEEFLPPPQPSIPFRPKREAKKRKPNSKPARNKYLPKPKSHRQSSQKMQSTSLSEEVKKNVTNTRSRPISELPITSSSSAPPDKPFKCEHEQCDFQSKYRANVIRHMKKHTGEILFPCELCRVSFGSKEHMIQHLAKIHNQPRDMNNGNGGDAAAGCQLVQVERTET